MSQDNSLVIDTKPKVYALFPEGEPIAGVIVGWKKLENVPTQFGPKTKVMCKVLTNLLDDDGERMTAIASFNASLNEKSTLRKDFLRPLLGYDPGPTFNLMDTKGLVRGFVFETNTAKDGRQFSNITAILKTSEKVTVPQGYVAFRPDEEKAAAPRQRQVATPVVESGNGNVAEI